MIIQKLFPQINGVKDEVESMDKLIYYISVENDKEK